MCLPGSPVTFDDDSSRAKVLSGGGITARECAFNEKGQDPKQTCQLTHTLCYFYDDTLMVAKKISKPFPVGSLAGLE